MATMQHHIFDQSSQPLGAPTPHSRGNCFVTTDPLWLDGWLPARVTAVTQNTGSTGDARAHGAYCPIYCTSHHPSSRSL